MLTSFVCHLGAFYSSSNSILRSVRKPNELVLMNLLYSNCAPNLTYCAEVKQLSSGDMNRLNVALNDAIRSIFTFNRWESTRFLRQQLNFPNITEIFETRRQHFIGKNRVSCNLIIRELTEKL